MPSNSNSNQIQNPAIMKLTISWINPSKGGRSIILSKSTVLPNGIRSIGNASGFVSLATVEQKLTFKVGDIVDLPDTAVLVKKEFTNKATGEIRSIDAWQF